MLQRQTPSRVSNKTVFLIPPYECHKKLCYIHCLVYFLKIDQTGSEQALEIAYRNAVAQLNDPSIRYESFDFHSECRNLKWHRLDILIDRLAHEQVIKWLLLI